MYTAPFSSDLMTMQQDDRPTKSETRPSQTGRQRETDRRTDEDVSRNSVTASYLGSWEWCFHSNHSCSTQWRGVVEWDTVIAGGAGLDHWWGERNLRILENRKIKRTVSQPPPLHLHLIHPHSCFQILPTVEPLCNGHQQFYKNFKHRIYNSHRHSTFLGFQNFFYSTDIGSYCYTLLVLKSDCKYWLLPVPCKK